TVLEKNPQDVNAKMLLSSIESALGNQKDALAIASDAVRIAPGNSAVYVNMAGLEQKYGSFAEAEAKLEKAHSLDIASIIPVMLLGTLYENQKRYDDASKQFQSAIQLDPKNPSPRKALAALYFSQGQIEQTEKVLSDAKVQMPDVPAGYRMLADFYIARGEKA